jgi:hypothetical protein
MGGWHEFYMRHKEKLGWTPIPFRFSTCGLPERERLPTWREQFSRALLRVDIEPLEGLRAPTGCRCSSRSQGLPMPRLSLLGRLEPVARRRMDFTYGKAKRRRLVGRGDDISGLVLDNAGAGGEGRDPPHAWARQTDLRRQDASNTNNKVSALHGARANLTQSDGRSPLLELASTSFLPSARTSLGV